MKYKKTKIKNNLFLIALFFLLFCLPFFALAGPYNYQPMEKIPGFETADVVNFYDYISVIYKFGIWAVGIAALLMIVIGGFMYITSAGNNASMEKAKGVITDAVAGLLLALTSWLILNTINPALVNITPITPVSIKPLVPYPLPGGTIGNGLCGEGGSCNSAFFEASTCFKGIYAKQAAQICYQESVGSVGAEGDTCVHGGANDKFSAGLFQINMIANGGMIDTACASKNVFNTYNGGMQGASLGGAKFDCEVKPAARSLYESCKARLKDMVLNIQLACKLSSSGINWKPWLNSRRKCGF